ncbi:uncharacterized protein [Montipora capricornis]|uniref:uncharacterized protein n=1 Tax=Montipora foliosa TaxID=591990 RepID=UPI0035F195BD
MSVTKDEVSDLIQANNHQLMASFKEMLMDTAGQIKHANETSTEQQMKEIKKLKFQEPNKFRRKANEDQYKFNLKLAETFDSAKSAAEKSNLQKVKLLVERQKHILLADKSEYGWSTVEEYKQHDLAADSEDEKRIYSAERRARAVMSSRKRKKSSAMAATKRSSPLRGSVSSPSSQFQTQSHQPATATSGFLPRGPNVGTCFACGKTGHWRSCWPR